MFETEGWRFVFKNLYHEDKSGRFDTLCGIYAKYEKVIGKVPVYEGIARLHPNDAPDKIVGKKQALLVAMKKSNGFYWADFYSKKARTVIWEAFWSWINISSKKVRWGECVVISSGETFSWHTACGINGSVVIANQTNRKLKFDITPCV